jgi:hypothetical protein
MTTSKEIRKTYEDGWNCVHQFGKIDRRIESLREIRYEISKCVRQSSTEDIIADLEYLAKDILKKCEELRSNGIHNVEFVTIEDQD